MSERRAGSGRPNPFHPRLESLPQSIPIFPLPGVILLPRAQLPLNIFEPRYLNMTLDALGAGRMIGMIQPDPARADDPDAIHRTGCSGRITAFSETDDGRLLIVLTGVCRFDVARELTPLRGYRRVEPAWSRFADDLSAADPPRIPKEELLEAAQAFLREKGAKPDMGALGELEPEALVNALAMGLPVSPSEKQALLEAPTAGERAEMLLTLVKLGTLPGGTAGATWH